MVSYNNIYNSFLQYNKKLFISNVRHLPPKVHKAEKQKKRGGNKISKRERSKKERIFCFVVK
jgi:hypothetical protein